MPPCRRPSARAAVFPTTARPCPRDHHWRGRVSTSAARWARGRAPARRRHHGPAGTAAERRAWRRGTAHAGGHRRGLCIGCTLLHQGLPDRRHRRRQQAHAYRHRALVHRLRALHPGLPGRLHLHRARRCGSGLTGWAAWSGQQAAQGTRALPLACRAPGARRGRAPRAPARPCIQARSTWPSIPSTPNLGAGQQESSDRGALARCARGQTAANLIARGATGPFASSQRRDHLGRCLDQLDQHAPPAIGKPSFDFGLGKVMS